jgi:GT2 family glycosyltransferase
MIAFASAIIVPEAYDAYAGPGIECARESDSAVLAHAADGSLFRNYNLILDEAAKLADLEALALVHQDAEIVDPGFCAKVREALADPDIGVIGSVGAIGVRSIAWWEGSVTWGSFTHRYPESEYGGGYFHGLAWTPDEAPPYARLGEVDTVDGFLMVLSPWVVRHIRFDESLGRVHGYDFDFCLQVREAGKKVVTADMRVIHHHSLTLIDDQEAWIEAHMRVADKWDGRMPGVGSGGGDWKQRARRAEAEAAVLRNQFISAGMHAEAQARMLRARLDEVTHSSSWRLTAPLRWLRRALKSSRGRSS